LLDKKKTIDVDQSSWVLWCFQYDRTAVTLVGILSSSFFSACLCQLSKRQHICMNSINNNTFIRKTFSLWLLYQHIIWNRECQSVKRKRYHEWIKKISVFQKIDLPFFNFSKHLTWSVSLPIISSVVIPSRSSPWNKRNRSSNIRNTLFLNCFIIFYFIQFCTHFRLQRFSHSMYRRLSNIDTSIAFSSTSLWRVSVAWLTLL